jgi:transposase
MSYTVCSDEAVSLSNVFEWFKRLKAGHEDLQDDPRSGPPSASRNAHTITNIREMVTRDYRLALRMMSVELNTNEEAIRQILHEDLRKRKMCSKFVPHRFTD